MAWGPDEHANTWSVSRARGTMILVKNGYFRMDGAGEDVVVVGEGQGTQYVDFMHTLAPKRPPHRYCPSIFSKFLSLAGPIVPDTPLSKVGKVLGCVSESCNDEVDSFVATVGLGRTPR
jgi:hypothetical protein